MKIDGNGPPGHENALPLIMTHGWPGSVIELLETVGPLTDPTAYGGSADDAFHLVPSLPGYGSRATGRGRWDLGRTTGPRTRYVARRRRTDAMGRQAPRG